MAKKKYEETDGVWRTIGGRRVFIRNGQSLSSAMKESGKFKNMRKDIQDNVKFKDMKEEEIKRHGVTAEEYRRAEETRANLGKAGRYEEALEAQKKYDDLMKKDGYIERKYKMPTKNEEDKFYTRKDDNKYKKENTSDWREQVKRNNELMEKELEDYKQKYDPFGKNLHNEKIHDDYYEIYRNNERRNAKIKQENPTEPYEYVEAYAGYNEKSWRLSGSKKGEDGSTDFGNGKWTGKQYTNDEFMEHLTDSNWHRERKMLEEAKLTNEELSYIKDHTTLSQWSVGEELTGSKNTQKMIDEAKNYSKYAKKIREKQNTPYYKQQMDKAVKELNKKYNNDVSPMSEWSDTTGTGFSDLQSSTLRSRYSGTYDYLQKTTNMSGAEILELLKRIDEDKR